MNRIERDFHLALALRCNEWRLGDNGTLSTVLTCENCDRDEVFESREDATAFLDSGELCEECGYGDPADRAANDAHNEHGPHVITVKGEK